MIKLKFITNKAVLKITNKTHETVTFGWTEMIGIVDLRSLGFYKIRGTPGTFRHTLPFQISKACM